MTRSSKILNTGRDSISAACSSALRRSASDTWEPLRHAQGRGECSELALQEGKVHVVALDALLHDLVLRPGLLGTPASRLGISISININIIIIIIIIMIIIDNNIIAINT